jgi:hypothetical protein
VTSIVISFLLHLLFYEEYRPYISEGVDIIYDYYYYQMTMRMNRFLSKPEAMQSVDRRFFSWPLAGQRLRLWTKRFIIPEVNCRHKCPNDDQMNTLVTAFQETDNLSL